MKYIIQLAAAFAGSLGFAGIFNIKRDKLLPTAFGGLLAWSIYLLAGLFMNGDVPRYFTAAVVLTIYAEIMARIKKTPATLFVVIAAIPLIPGGSLYTTMRYAIEGRQAECFGQAVFTLLLAAAIACGILCAMTLWTILEKSTRFEIMKKQ